MPTRAVLKASKVLRKFAARCQFVANPVQSSFIVPTDALDACTRPQAVGAVASAPLQRERPLGLREYGLFALSGAIGCALTHLVVVPLDVRREGGGRTRRVRTPPHSVPDSSAMPAAL